MQENAQNTEKKLSKAHLKARLNFASMFERQEEQVNKSVHIKELLNPSTCEKDTIAPSTTNKESQGFNDRIEKLEGQYNTDSMNQRFEQLEESFNRSLTEGLEKKTKININLNDKKMVYSLCAAFLMGCLIFGIAFSGDEKTIIEEKIVYKTSPIKSQTSNLESIQGKSELFVMTKYVNIRSKASSKGSVLATLAPNSVVERLEQKYGWHKVKYTNHLKGTTLIGWAYGENLKKI
jgi:hypothetical protein